MPSDREDPRRVGHYVALSQVGFEMAAPIGLGYLIDYWLGWFPWLTITGAVLGLAGGLFQLVAMTKEERKDGSSEDSTP
jgi:F0F1-type ATP synthase assembly protein I